MAISKTQNERPAIIDLIDASNEHATSIANLTTGLQAEMNIRQIEDGEIRAALAGEISNRIAAVQNVQNQIGDGFSDVNTITHSLSTTNQQLSLLANQVDTVTNQVDNVADDLSDVSDAVEAIQSDLAGIGTDVANLLLFEGRIQIGQIDNLVIPANDSLSTSEVFAQPFDSGSSCIVLAQVITSEISTLFDFTLIDCTYSGFSYSISNSDADAHTVALGYVAIRTTN